MCLLFFVVVFIMCYLNAPKITEFLLALVKDAGFTLVYVSPTEMLLQSLRLCGVITLIVSLPVFAWHITMYCLPAIETRMAKRIFVICVIAAYVLFTCGILFCRTILFPFVFRYLYEYAQLFTVEGMATVSSILNLVLSIMWAMGLLFEFPLLCAALSCCGVLKAAHMVKAFKPAVLVIAIIAAAITPPDVISMGIVVVPLLGDYVIGICTCIMFERKSRERS